MPLGLGGASGGRPAWLGYGRVTVATPPQLVHAATGVAYRSSQLAGLALLTGRPAHLDIPELPGFDTSGLLGNMRVESALVHSRALAYFLTKQAGGTEVAAADYLAECGCRAGVTTDLVQVSGKVIGPVSDHLAHSKYHDERNVDPDGRPRHPGAWPIMELAVVLVGGVAEVVAMLDAEWQANFRSGSDTPQGLAPILSRAVGSSRTVPSEHAAVRRLTLVLHAYLDAREA